MAGDWALMGWGMWIFWAVLVLIVVLAVAGLSGRGAGTPDSPGQSALEILKARYARGELDKDQFERMRKDLEV